jgi:Na+/H+-dicarboxylate symporter
VLVVGIHRFMGQAMAVTNTIGNSVAAIVIGDRCGQLDRVQLDREFGNAAVTADAESVGHAPKR